MFNLNKLKHRWGLEWAHTQKGEYTLFCDQSYTDFRVKQTSNGKWFVKYSNYDGLQQKSTYKGMGQFDTAKEAMEFAEKVYKIKETPYRSIFR